MTAAPLHMGPMHPVETLLVLLLAFGPLAALAVVVLVARRRDARLEREEAEAADPSQQPPDLPADHHSPSTHPHHDRSHHGAA